MSEEKVKGDFFKEKTKEEYEKEILEFLDEAKFNFACFADHFKRYFEKYINETGS